MTQGCRLAASSFCFVAPRSRDLVPSTLEGDEQYPVWMRKVPLNRFVDLCMAGVLHDALAIAALCLAQTFLQREAT